MQGVATGFSFSTDGPESVTYFSIVVLVCPVMLYSQACTFASGCPERTYVGAFLVECLFVAANAGKPDISIACFSLLFTSSSSKTPECTPSTLERLMGKKAADYSALLVVDQDSLLRCRVDWRCSLFVHTNYKLGAIVP